MFEDEDAFAALVVLAVLGRLVDGPPTDGDLSVGAVLARHGHLRHGDALLHQDTALLEADRSRLCVSFQFGTTGKKLSTVTSIPFKIIEEKATSEYIDPWLVHSTANQ